MVLERLPPNDIEAEEAVIASLLVDSEAILRVSPILKPDDFFREKNGWVYDACVSLWTRNEAINEITVAHELARRERLEAAGGHGFLSQLLSDLPTTVGVEDYARIVARDAVYRRLSARPGGSLRQLTRAAPTWTQCSAALKPCSWRSAVAKRCEILFTFAPCSSHTLSPPNQQILPPASFAPATSTWTPCSGA